MFGYHGKLLWVDLNEKKFEVRGLDDALLEKYVGGAGLGARTLYDETTADTDPLGPEMSWWPLPVLLPTPRSHHPAVIM